MTGVTNGDGSPIREMFGMDASGYYHSNAPGSQGGSGRAADSVPATVTPPAGTWWNQASTSTSGTVEPAQMASSVITPGPQADYSHSGAGEGSCDHWARFPWQQPQGDASQ